MFGNLLGNITPVVKNILLLNILFFVAQLTLPELMNNLALYPFGSNYFKPWQLATHFFMHGGLVHLFFNMFALVIFGAHLERVWGPKRFLTYYMACAFGAAFLHQFVIFLELNSIVNLISENDWNILKEHGSNIFEEIKTTGAYSTKYGIDLNKNENLVQYLFLSNIPMLGASGAVFGLLAAFGYLFPNTELRLLFPPIPIKAKYFVLGYAALELYLGFANNPSDNVAHFAHIGGALIGIILVLYWKKNRNQFSS